MLILEIVYGKYMEIKDYIKIAKKLFRGNSKKIVINQIKEFYNCINKYKVSNKYKVGDDVLLKKGTLLHGTYKNIDGLKEIINNGLIAGSFTDGGRVSKYPDSVGVWNLKQDYLLKDYVNFYSGATILYFNMDNRGETSKIIPYDKMKNILNYVGKVDTCHKWTMEQTKEARFMPSFVQNRVQIGIIIDGNNRFIKNLLNGDILSSKISDRDVESFLDPYYYKRFLKERKNKNDFFTDRESAILFGIPPCFIEGVLVGKKYEKDAKILNQIKELVPNAYICNLKGKVIK